MTAATVPNSQTVVHQEQQASDAVDTALIDVFVEENHGEIQQPRRWSGEEYRRLYESGVFPADRRSQLIQGEVYFMAAVGKAHYKAIKIFNRLLTKLYGDLADIVPQAPIVLWNDSEPEPDFALVHLDSTNDPAHAKDVVLAIEVSDPGPQVPSWGQLRPERVREEC
jgi:Uma2 family endonuclease